MSRSPDDRERQPLLQSPLGAENASPISATAVVTVQNDQQANETLAFDSKSYIKLISSAVGWMLTSFNTAFNCLFVVWLGYNAACSLITSYQSMFRNVGTGALTGLTLQFGKAIGGKKYIDAAKITITGYAITLLLTLACTIAYGASYFVLPKLFREKTAFAAYTYLLWSIIGNWSTLALITLGQIVFQTGDWKSPLASVMTFRLGAIGLDYLLAIREGWGVKGIGIANGIAPWVAYLGLEIYAHYYPTDTLDKLWDALKKDLGLSLAEPITSLKIIRNIVKENFKLLFQRCLQMAVQKLTEWGNLFVIAMVLGAAKSEHSLTAMNASLQLMNFFNMFSQGVGQGAVMLLTLLKGALKSASEEASSSNEKIVALQKRIKRILYKSLAMGFAVNVICGLVLYVARREIVDLFIHKNTSDDTRRLAETVLWVNGVGLPGDSLRMISGSALAAWDKILPPNIVSLVAMTLIGVPLSYLISLKKSDEFAVIAMFVIRTAMLYVSAGINSFMLYQCAKRDQKKVPSPTSDTAIASDLFRNSESETERQASADHISPLSTAQSNTQAF